MTKMNCVSCSKEIDYDKTRQVRAYNFGTEEKHVCEGFGQKKPFPKTWSKKAFNDTTNLQYDAVLKELEVVKQDVESLKEAVRALVAEVSFKKGTDKSLESS